MSLLRISPGLLAKSLVLVLAVALNAPLLAGDWHTVMTGKAETIDIDKSRIAQGAGGITGWRRVVLGREVKDPGGVYDTIQAQNLYDCDKRRFTTLRRAYFRGDTLIREESVARERANSIQIGSIDERLFNAACGARPAAVATADAPRRSSARVADEDAPSAMHADMRTLDENAAVRVVPVVDATPKPVQPLAQAGASATPTPVPAADRPRRIILPVIDKAAADAATAAALSGSGGSSGSGAKSAPAAVPPAPTAAVPAPVATKPAPLPAPVQRAPAPEPRRTAPVAPAADPVAPSDKRIRELQYATSGPRRVAPKKVEEPAPPSLAHIHWSYEGEGAPAIWGKLRPEYATCANGRRQSPIDIRDGIKVDLEQIKFDYKLTQFRIIDNGHTLHVTAGEGLGMSIMGKRYELQQLHFHRPGEERINGRLYDMSVHLVHRNDEGQLAVIAVLLEKGSEHPVIQTLWNNMPLERDLEVTPAEAIDLVKLLPENRAYWTYMGSLTTPPCTEDVLWMVMKQPVQVSPEQVSIFSRLYRNNARPVQPSNGRLIKESR